MKGMEELKEMLCDELDEITEKGKITAGDLDAIDKLTHSIKSLETIMAMSEYSNDGGSYDGGSYAQRRDSMGRYSRDNYSRGRNSRGYSRRGYSRDGYSYGKEDMIEELEGLMDSAESEKEREAIRRCIDQMR